MTLPLAGYRVLELAHLIAGPVCGMYLADMGADVVKIEQPTGGDASRTTYGTQLGGESAVFVTVNRNKRSVALDLARPEGRAAFERLVARADVVLEAYRGGVAERLGIDWARLAPLNPRLVYCSLSAFGPDGPWREKPGVDMLVQAMGGVMAVTGEPGRTARALRRTGARHDRQPHGRTGHSHRAAASRAHRRGPARRRLAPERHAARARRPPVRVPGHRRGARPLGKRSPLPRAVSGAAGRGRLGLRRGVGGPAVDAVLRGDRTAGRWPAIHASPLEPTVSGGARS